MKNKLIQITIIAFSAVYLAVAVSTFTGDRLYSMTFSVETRKRTIDNAIGLINAAIMLDPGNAELYFRKYELLFLLLQANEMSEAIPKNEIRKQQLFLLKKCIELRPFWAKCHLLYGLTLKNMYTRRNFITQQLINSELKKAVKLKPSSEKYQRICEKNLQ